MAISKVIEVGGNKSVVDQNNFPIRRVAEYYGLSTDVKPADANNADIFYEMDTQKVSLFDEDSGTWLEQ